VASALEAGRDLIQVDVCAAVERPREE